MEKIFYESHSKKYIKKLQQNLRRTYLQSITFIKWGYILTTENHICHSQISIQNVLQFINQRLKYLNNLLTNQVIFIKYYEPDHIKFGDERGFKSNPIPKFLVKRTWMLNL